MSEKLLNVQEVSEYLDISRQEVEHLVSKGKIPAYKIGGSYLRFKKRELDIIKASFKLPAKGHAYTERNDYSIGEKVRDFFYFNDFYIVSIMIIVAILILLYRT